MFSQLVLPSELFSYRLVFNSFILVVKKFIVVGDILYISLFLFLFTELTNCTILLNSHKMNLKYTSQFKIQDVSLLYNWPSCFPLLSKVPSEIQAR